MKKRYIAPDMDVIKVIITDVILYSPTEGQIPSDGNLDPTLPSGTTEVDF